MEKELDFSAEIQRDIFGMQDAHVRKIEKELQVSIVSRNGAMKVIGEEDNESHTLGPQKPSAEVTLNERHIRITLGKRGETPADDGTRAPA